MSAALKVPKNTVASIIPKWNKVGTTNTLPRAGRPANLRNLRRRVSVRDVTKNPTEFLCGDGRTFQKVNNVCSTPPIRPLC